MYHKRQNGSNQVIIIILIIALFIFLIAHVLTRDGGSSEILPTSFFTQQEALQRLADESGQSVYYIGKNNVIRHLSFTWGETTNQNPQLLVDNFITKYADIFSIKDPQEQLQLIEQYQDENRAHTFSYEQIYQGIPVYGSGLAFHVSPNGILDWYEGGYLPNLVVDTSPSITAQQAVEAIQRQLPGEEIFVVKEPNLTIYDVGVMGEDDSIDPRLAWVQVILSDSAYATYFVDAHNGNVIDSIPVLEELRFEIYDEDEKSLRSLFLDPGEVVYDQDGKKKIGLLTDSEATRLAEQIEKVYDFYYDNFEWRSYDNGVDDSLIKIHINVKENPNAWWDGEQKEIYFTNDLVGESGDVLAHEFTHGITNTLVGFKHFNYSVSESRALSESFSDIFAAFIDQDDPWRICVNDCKKSPFEPLDLIRNLEDPDSIGYPQHYSDLVKPGDKLCVGSEIEYGCGHVNSTIHSYAVYLFTEQIGMTKSSHILFNALQSDMLVNTPNFAMARRVIENTCQDMIGGDYNITIQDCNYISDAYDAVGIEEPMTAVDPSGRTYFVTATSPVIQANIQSKNSETVLVMDVSGSMGEMDSNGVEKMLGAQRAASDLVNVIISEQDAAGDMLIHKLGLVAFSSYAVTLNPLTQEIEEVQDELWQLDPGGRTAMVAGLNDAIAQLETENDAQRMIILLSDGLPNIGLNSDSYGIQEEVIDLARQAGEMNICVHTIGFGDPMADPDSESYIDEDFLTRVAQASGCGKYYSAQESGQLANAFIELRHETMGTLVLQETGTIAQSELIDLGDVNISLNYEQLLFTLNWPGSYLLTNITDPAGRLVDEDYPGLTINEQDTITTIIIDQPVTGNWNISIYGQDVPEGITTYNALMSTRGLIEKESGIPIWLWVLIFSIVIVGLLIINSSHHQAVYKGNSSHIQTGEAWVRSAYLQVVNGEQAGKNYRLDGQTLIGRGSYCQILLKDISVSRTHAVLFFTEGRWFIQDQNSRSGVYLNDRRIKQAKLHTRDKLKLGHTELIFIWE